MNIMKLTYMIHEVIFGCYFIDVCDRGNNGRVNEQLT